MNVLIIEDEKHNVSRLQRILAEISPSILVIGVLTTVKDSVIWLSQTRELNPDVILMDIRLADGISFDIFEQVDVSTPIIFTTSYDEYAIRAFKVNSVDYLLKPIEKEEMEEALEKVKIKKREVNPDIEQLVNLFKKQTTIYRKRFLLPKTDGYKIVTVDDIDYFYSELKTTNLVNMNGSQHLLQQTLDDLEDELDPSLFFRMNRQFIVNINSILSIKNMDNGKLRIILKNDSDKEIIVSREKASLLKRWMDK